jgi:hypothetical protein
MSHVVLQSEHTQIGSILDLLTQVTNEVSRLSAISLNVHPVSSLELPVAERMYTLMRGDMVDVAKFIYKIRRVRTDIFGSELGIFGEPAWDILLDLIYPSMARSRSQYPAPAWQPMSLPPRL